MSKSSSLDCARLDLIDESLVVLHQFAVDEVAAALPIDGFGNPALLTGDHFVESRHGDGCNVVHLLNTDILPSHFVCSGGSCTGSKMEIENDVSYVTTKFKNPGNEVLRLWIIKNFWRSNSDFMCPVPLSFTNSFSSHTLLCRLEALLCF